MTLAAGSVEEVIQTVEIENLKTVAGASANALANTFTDYSASRGRLAIMAEGALADQQSHRTAMNHIQQLYLGKLAEKFTEVDPMEAVSTAKVFKGESDSSVLSLLSSLSGGQIAGKIAVTTPPETGVSRGVADLLTVLEAFKNVKA